MKEILKEMYLHGQDMQKIAETKNAGLIAFNGALMIATLKFIEDSPNNVDAEAIVDFQKLLKNKEIPPSPYQISSNLKKYFGDYLGIEYGSPVHGKMDFYFNTTPTYIGLDEWTKNEFNKKIKKEIKNLPSAEKNISSLKLILNNSRFKAEIKIGWKRDSRWSEHNKIKEEVRNLLNSMGYNTEIKTHGKNNDSGDSFLG